MKTTSIPVGQIDLPKAEFILEQSEHLLDNILEDRRVLHAKANYLIGAGSGISAFLLTATMSLAEGNILDPLLFRVSFILACIGFLISGIML